jgi:hypothetical protein
VSSKQKWFDPLSPFFGHTIVGTSVFLCIFAPAIALNIILHILEHRFEIDHWLIWGATAGGDYACDGGYTIVLGISDRHWLGGCQGTDSKYPIRFGEIKEARL